MHVVVASYQGHSELIVFNDLEEDGDYFIDSLVCRYSP